MMTIQQLKEIALRFRVAMENMPGRDMDPNLKDFPEGVCGEASYFLGTHLIELGEKAFDYMLGFRKDGSHAWLQRDGLIIDITADQFPEISEAVIVTRDSSWHDALDGSVDGAADYRRFVHGPGDHWDNLYSKIIATLNNV